MEMFITKKISKTSPSSNRKGKKKNTYSINSAQTQKTQRERTKAAAKKAITENPRSMRSNIPLLGDGDAAATAASSYWWRTLPEFTSIAGRRFSAVNARLRVLKEMERLASVAHESLDDLRHRLCAYKSGDLWLPAGGIAKEATDIPPVITILLLGFAGTGKSSLVNLMYSVLGRSGFVPFAQTSSSLPAGRDGRTLCLEEHNVLRSMRNGFCVFDSRGLDYSRLSEGLDEVSEWMEDGVRHCQLCRGSGIPETSPASLGPSSSSSSYSSTSAAAAAAKRFLRRRVNCAVVVASVSELYRSMMAGDLRPVEATRELFHAPSIKTYCSEYPILILTHGDELRPEERIEGRIRVCDYLGISETIGVYDVVCLNEHGPMVDEMDPVTAYSLSESLYRALLIADRGHPPKPSVRDWLLLMLSWALCSLSALFAFLSCLCSKLAKANGSREHKLRLQ